MWIFFKAQISSLSATLLDFLITIFLVEAFHFHIVQATLVGAVSGAFANFFINKYWSFESGREHIRQQSVKYFIVWIGSLLLNVCGVYILTGELGLNYIISKILVSLVVGIAFNYTLQKHYVFAKNEKIFIK